MKLRLARWGNSLAIRLPVACTRAAGLAEGDAVEALVSPAGAITLIPSRRFDRGAFVARARKRLAGMPVTRATVEAMRETNRF
jgi:antitoxin MazE